MAVSGTSDHKLTALHIPPIDWPCCCQIVMIRGADGGSP